MAGKSSKQGGKPQRRVTGSQSSGGIADWIAVNAELVMQAVAAVSAQGGAVRLGYTRDGGAYSIGIYGDGEPYTEYLPPSSDLERFFTDLREAWE